MNTDLFTRLARRAIGERPVVQPRVDPLLDQGATEQPSSVPAGDAVVGVADTEPRMSTNLNGIERFPAVELGLTVAAERVAERPMQPRPAAMVADAATTALSNEPGDSNVVMQDNAARHAGDAASQPRPAAWRPRPIAERGSAASVALPVPMVPAPERPLPMAAVDQERVDDRNVAPVIGITIDRIEVRTERPARGHGKPQTAQPAGGPKPALPLADYLVQRRR